MQYFLRKLDTNWADEFDTFGMKIYTELEHGRLVDALESVKDVEVEWSFGTNQWHTAKISEFIKDTEVHLISGDQVDMLTVLFPNIESWGVGSCSDIADLLEDFEDGSELDTPAVNEYWRYRNEQYELNCTKS